jgi:hypothetical protein
MKTLKYCFVFVDTCFVIYWLITVLHIIPAEFLYNDYKNPILVHWNWSFFPLDLLVSATGYYSIYLNGRQNLNWRKFALLSLILTSVSGLQAISYWTFANEFDLTWWIPNLFLLLYPLYFLPKIFRYLK